MVKKQAYKGRRRGAKPKGGFYGSLAVRVANAKVFNDLANLSPEARGAAMVSGAGLGKEAELEPATSA